MEKIRYISGERCLPDGEILVQVAERVSEIVEWINRYEHDQAGGEHDPK